MWLNAITALLFVSDYQFQQFNNTTTMNPNPQNPTSISSYGLLENRLKKQNPYGEFQNSMVLFLYKDNRFPYRGFFRHLKLNPKIKIKIEQSQNQTQWVISLILANWPTRNWVPPWMPGPSSNLVISGVQQSDIIPDGLNGGRWWEWPLLISQTILAALCRSVADDEACIWFRHTCEKEASYSESTKIGNEEGEWRDKAKH